MTRSGTKLRARVRGFTLIELLIAMAISGVLLLAMAGLAERSLQAQAIVNERNRLNSEARFAMQRMVRAIRDTRVLLLPLTDHPGTSWRENVREETVPASPPESGSTRATAVLAVSLSTAYDLDADGFPDADNDRDGRIDEDLPGDATYDVGPGLYFIDDDGDGAIDEGLFAVNNDDEQDDGWDEDPSNGADDDGDGATDEDPSSDMNGDGAPGVAGIDDDGDGAVDEGSASDDDEDGASNEDWLDAHAFYLQGSSLVERQPVPWDASGIGGVSGRDVIVSVIAEDVTRFRVERPLPSPGGRQLVHLTLELTGASGEAVSLSASVRVGETP